MDSHALADVITAHVQVRSTNEGLDREFGMPDWPYDEASFHGLDARHAPDPPVTNRA